MTMTIHQEGELIRHTCINNTIDYVDIMVNYKFLASPQLTLNKTNSKAVDKEFFCRAKKLDQDQNEAATPED